jgi:LysM repeat protein
MKIVNVKRFIISSALLMLLSMGSINLAVGMFPSHADEITSFTRYEVEPGDTVWDIARQFTQKDVRDLVYEIGVVNGLKNFVIRPGDVLRIPDNF